MPYGVTSFVHNVEHGCLPESVAATDRLLGISSSEISANIIVMQYIIATGLQIHSFIQTLNKLKV